MAKASPFRARLLPSFKARLLFCARGAVSAAVAAAVAYSEAATLFEAFLLVPIIAIMATAPTTGESIALFRPLLVGCVIATVVGLPLGALVIKPLAVMAQADGAGAGIVAASSLVTATCLALVTYVVGSNSSRLHRAELKLSLALVAITFVLLQERGAEGDITLPFHLMLAVAAGAALPIIAGLAPWPQFAMAQADARLQRAVTLCIIQVEAVVNALVSRQTPTRRHKGLVREASLRALPVDDSTPREYARIEYAAGRARENLAAYAKAIAAARYEGCPAGVLARHQLWHVRMTRMSNILTVLASAERAIPTGDLLERLSPFLREPLHDVVAALRNLLRHHADLGAGCDRWRRRAFCGYRALVPCSVAPCWSRCRRSSCCSPKLRQRPEYSTELEDALRRLWEGFTEARLRRIYGLRRRISLGGAAVHGVPGSPASRSSRVSSDAEWTHDEEAEGDEAVHGEDGEGNDANHNTARSKDLQVSHFASVGEMLIMLHRFSHHALFLCGLDLTEADREEVEARRADELSGGCCRRTLRRPAALLRWLWRRGASLREWAPWRRPVQDRRFGVKTALAVVLSAVPALTPAARGKSANFFWAPMTVAFVADPSLGATFHVSIMRLQGTVFGSLFSYVVLLWLEDVPVAASFLLALFVGLATYVRTNPTLTYGGTVAAFTSALIMLAPKGDTSLQQYALARVEHTLVGIVCFMIAANALWPSRAGSAAVAHGVDAVKHLHAGVDLCMGRVTSYMRHSGEKYSTGPDGIVLEIAHRVLEAAGRSLESPSRSLTAHTDPDVVGSAGFEDDTPQAGPLAGTDPLAAIIRAEKSNAALLGSVSLALNEPTLWYTPVPATGLNSIAAAVKQVIVGLRLTEYSLRSLHQREKELVLYAHTAGRARLRSGSPAESSADGVVFEPDSFTIPVHSFANRPPRHLSALLPEFSAVRTSTMATLRATGVALATAADDDISDMLRRAAHTRDTYLAFQLRHDKVVNGLLASHSDSDVGGWTPPDSMALACLNSIIFGFGVVVKGTEDITKHVAAVVNERLSCKVLAAADRGEKID